MGNHAVNGTDINTLFSLGISHHQFDGFTVDPELRKVSLTLIPRPFLCHKFASSWTASWLAIKFKETFRTSLSQRGAKVSLISTHARTHARTHPRTHACVRTRRVPRRYETANLHKSIENNMLLGPFSRKPSLNSSACFRSSRPHNYSQALL